MLISGTILLWRINVQCFAVVQKIPVRSTFLLLNGIVIIPKNTLYSSKHAAHTLIWQTPVPWLWKFRNFLNPPLKHRLSKHSDPFWLLNTFLCVLSQANVCVCVCVSVCVCSVGPHAARSSVTWSKWFAERSAELTAVTALINLITMTHRGTLC